MTAANASAEMQVKMEKAREEIVAASEMTPERTVVCTLTAPHDAADIADEHRGAYAQTWNSVRRGSRKLDGDSLDAALAVLCDRSFASAKFDMRETRFCDPLIPGQNLSLFSFVPAKGARPDKKGVYGYGKIRGTFESDVDARTREEVIVRDHDSYHTIMTMRTGQPFPVVSSGAQYAAETSEVDVKKDMAESIADDVKKKRREEKEAVEKIKQREEKLLKKSQKTAKGEEGPVEGDEDDEDAPLEKYTTLRMKKAQLIFTYRENKKKLDEVRERVLDAVRQIAQIDSETPEYKEQYKERIVKARTDAGMDTDFSDENFLRFVSDDFDLATIFAPGEIPADLADVSKATSLREDAKANAI